MYEKIKSLIKEEGHKLISKAGKVPDIGKSKQWLTEHDIAIERKITELVESFGENHKVFGEEEHTDFEFEENIWIVDPISHTNNFLAGIPHFAVVVSHMKNKKIVFSAIYDPTMDELFEAEKGKGAFLNGERIHVSTREKGNCTIFYQPYYSDKAGEIYDKLYQYGFVKSFGSMGLHYAYVASGRIEAAITITKDMFPEFAGKLLVEEAGGIFTQFDGEDINLDSPNILASNRVVYDKLRKDLAINN